MSIRDWTMTTGETYAELSNQTVSAANGAEYVYRDAGQGGVPLVLLQHFRGNLDNWDPALIDELASSRRVVTFDNVGVGGTTGNTPHRFEQMAHDAIAFLRAMDFDQVDILGFSIGSFVAQEIALLRPALLRKLILASSAPQGAAGMHGWAPDVIQAVGARQSNPEGVLDVFTPTLPRAGRLANKPSSACSSEHRAATCPPRGKPDKLSTTPFVRGEFRITVRCSV